MSTFRDLKRIRIGFGPRSYDLFTISNIAKDKSFVDDLNKERGIVSMRVGFVLRSTEIKPLFSDLCNFRLAENSRISSKSVTTVVFYRARCASPCVAITWGLEPVESQAIPGQSVCLCCSQ